MTTHHDATTPRDPEVSFFFVWQVEGSVNFCKYRKPNRSVYQFWCFYHYFCGSSSVAVLFGAPLQPVSFENGLYLSDLFLFLQDCFLAYFAWMIKTNEFLWTGGDKRCFQYTFFTSKKVWSSYWFNLFKGPSLGSDYLQVAFFCHQEGLWKILH